MFTRSWQGNITNTKTGQVVEEVGSLAHIRTESISESFYN